MQAHVKQSRHLNIYKKKNCNYITMHNNLNPEVIPMYLNTPRILFENICVWYKNNQCIYE